ncbi:MAG: hypothetical protein HY318_07210 [Armatimonadetes bacterium]|nr:hypothetical protein [Armatimonadota bacterium]
MCVLQLSGTGIQVLVSNQLGLSILARDGSALWKSAESHGPTIAVRTAKGDIRDLPLSRASNVTTSDYAEGKHQGHALRLSGFTGTDVALELVFAIDPDAEEVVVQVAQVAGSDTVVSVDHLYRFEKPVTDGGYVVLPHGSGYLIPAECPDCLPGQGPKGGFIGGRWSLPMFGMVRGNDAICVIVETWWDCDVEAEHVPGHHSALNFTWRDSLGKLDYPRRFLIRFAEGMDYVAMAKLYRTYARDHGLLRTLEEKVARTPAILRYIENILFRWPAWNASDGSAVLSDLLKMREAGLGVNFFFPKWSSAGYSPERGTANTANAGWQAYLQNAPVPGGWETLADLAAAVHQLGCTIQGFVGPRTQDPDGQRYDEDRYPRDPSGQLLHDLSTHDALDRTRWVLDNIEARGLKYDVLYFDGYSAHHNLPQDFSPSHPVTRRQTFEAQSACFAETRLRGIMPGGELARFWCMADCDYFFFTDWSSDRLANTPNQGASAPVGEPVPVFQLVFHDCHIAGFSGGGYALYAPGYDWWADRTPRLYELLFASAPAYNWLPDSPVPVRDWDSERMDRRLGWLKRWITYYRAVATSEMVSHRFLSADQKRQCVEFANGVVAEFDMANNRFRVIGIAGFSGDWEKPEEL